MSLFITISSIFLLKSMSNFYLPLIIRGMSIHHPKALVKIVKAITTLQEPHNFILTSYHAGGGH